jgi:hypothetical protein
MAVALTAEITNACTIFVVKPEWKRRLEYLGVNGDNIKMHFKGTGCEGVNGIYLAQDKYRYPGLVNMVLELRTAQKLTNLLTSCTTISFLSRIMLLIIIKQINGII